MTIVNSPKLIIIGLIIVCATAGWLVGRMDATQWLATIGPFGGYLVGNGITAARGKDAEPVIGATPERKAAAAAADAGNPS